MWKKKWIKKSGQFKGKINEFTVDCIKGPKNDVRQEKNMYKKQEKRKRNTIKKEKNEDKMNRE